MKYLVISDTHGYKNYLYRVLDSEPDIKNIIFLGDGLNDVMVLKSQRPDLNIIAVAGNCDVNKNVPTNEIIDIKGYRVMLCHGDGYYVKLDYLPIRKACLELKVDIALFGHTHIRYYEYLDGKYLFNPGSVMPSAANPFSCYGIMDFDGSRPVFYHREI